MAANIIHSKKPSIKMQGRNGGIFPTERQLYQHKKLPAQNNVAKNKQALSMHLVFS